MPTVTKILPNYTYDDYLHWEGRWELIEGMPYAMSPMPRPRHQEIAVSLGSVFQRALQDSPCSCTVYQPIDMMISNNTIVQPDLLVVCAPIEKNYLDFAPELVVEILSPATALKDRVTKFELYQHFGIKYYIIVDIDQTIVELYTLNHESGQYEQIPPESQIALGEACEISPDFNSIW